MASFFKKKLQIIYFTPFIYYPYIRLACNKRLDGGITRYCPRNSIRLTFYSTPKGFTHNSMFYMFNLTFSWQAELELAVLEPEQRR